jgi:Tfp pilus assembly protein PilX
MKQRLRRRGAALAVALCTLLVVTLITGTVVRSLAIASRQSRQACDELQAQWLAEAGVMRAKAQLARQPDYTRETWTPSIGSAAGVGTVQIQVKRPDSDADPLQIVVLAHYPNHEWRRATAARDHTLPVPPTRPPSVEANTAANNPAEKTP